MKAEIITIGDEILIGQTIDTNSAWIAKELNSLGIKVDQITSIKDEKRHIIKALNEVQDSTQLVLITGGLGPTKDDITKKVLTEYFGTELVRNEKVLQRIDVYFKSRGREILETNRQQADLPKDCQILFNEMGTASGMWFEKGNTVFVSMPGVPYEMKHLMTERIIPRVQEKYELPHLVHKTIMTEGIGESFLAEIIRDWESSVELENISLAYLPSPGIVKIRLSAEGNRRSELEEKVNRIADQLHHLIPNYIFGEDDVSMEEAIGKRLRETGESISTAESCTGGYIAHLLTSVSGSSDYFPGSIISYSNQVKEKSLGVSKSDLEEFGAVSQQVVEQMAEGVRRVMSTTYGLATSGVAGPEGGSEEKPVGTVWIALATEKGTFSKKFTFEKSRERNIRRSALAAISMVRRCMDGSLDLE